MTIGSPLGADTFVLPHLEPGPVAGVGTWPGCVRDWVNIAAVGDQACQQPRLAEAFGAAVTDHIVDNGHRAHDPEPYLCSAATGRAVSRGLS